MLEQDDHFKHLSDNPTYIHPEDWRRTDELIDWLIEKNKTGYQMVNSVQRLQEMKAFMRMGGNASDLKTLGWNGDGTGNGAAKQVMQMPGIVLDSAGNLRFAEWNCRAGQNNVIMRTDGTVGPCFPMYSSPFDWETSISRSSTLDSWGNEEVLPAPLLLYAKSQSCVLLPRLTCHQVCLHTNGEKPHERRSAQF